MLRPSFCESYHWDHCRQCRLGYHCNSRPGCKQDPNWRRKRQVFARSFNGYRYQPPNTYDKLGLTPPKGEPTYWGVMFPDGKVVIRWNTKVHSTEFFLSFTDFYSVHGHPEYITEVIFADGLDENGSPLEDDRKEDK